MGTIDLHGLDDLWEEMRNDPDFEHLRVGKIPLVPGEGSNPRAFIIGEAPGAYETIAKRPFVGPAGKVLRQLMEIAELWATPRWSHGSEKFPETTGEVPANCWLTNVIKYRPLKNRTPTFAEIKNSRKYIRREWELVGRPRVIIPVGRPALECVMGRQMSIIACAGQLIPETSRVTLKSPFAEPMTVWPMLHPSYVLREKDRNPKLMDEVEAHWEKLGEWLRQNDSH